MLKITVINCDGRYINYEWNSKREFVLDMESSNEHIPMLDDKLIEINGKSNKNYNIVDDLYKECKEEQQMGLKKYIVTYYEAYSKGYEVEAANKEEAEEIVRNDIFEGKRDAPDNCYDSGCYTEEIS